MIKFLGKIRIIFWIQKKKKKKKKKTETHKDHIFRIFKMTSAVWWTPNSNEQIFMKLFLRVRRALPEEGMVIFYARFGSYFGQQKIQNFFGNTLVEVCTLLSSIKFG